MKITSCLTLASALALTFGLAHPGAATENAPRQADSDSTVVQSDERGDASTDPRDGRVQEKETGKGEVPRYKPPRMGRVWRTIGGATRGSETCRPVIAVLAPDNHSGLTTREQPTLYWYLSDACPRAIEFTVIEEGGIAPLVEVSLSPPQRPGLQALDLAPYRVRLQVGKLYMWSIAFVPDRDHRSKDIVAQGGIRRVDPDHALAARLAAASEDDAPQIYAEAGLWYDAIAELSALIQRKPSSHALKLQRASLLEQVHLLEIAQHEALQAGTNPG